jgi:methionyl-tRNA formyltransferase
MKIAVIGGVESTALLLRKLRQHGFLDVRVWAYAPADNSEVSGWSDVFGFASTLGYSAEKFNKVSESLVGISEFQPELLFAVGLSQLIPDAIIRIPRLGCIGFHPTKLPLGRGRAPIAWIVMEGVPAAATFFKITGGVDDGPIIEQEEIDVLPSDDACSVTAKVLDAMSEASDRMLRAIAQGVLMGAEQDHRLATWYGRRAPDDGCISWDDDASKILKHIRSATNPHPGAFTFCADEKIVIWKAEICGDPHKGITGRVLFVGVEQCFVVQCGLGLVRIKEWSSKKWTPRVGQLLGFNGQLELSKLRERCSVLESRVAQLERLWLNK